MTVTKEEFLDFVKGKNPKPRAGVLEYYEEAFEASQKKAWFVQPNWGAMYATFLWALYRGMYLHAFLYMFLVIAGTVAIAVVIIQFNLAKIYGVGLTVLVHMLLSYLLPTFYATAFYTCWVKKKIAKGKKSVGTAIYRMIVPLIIIVGFMFFSLFMGFKQLSMQKQPPPQVDILQEYES